MSLLTTTATGSVRGGVGKTTTSTLAADLMTAYKRGHLQKAIADMEEAARGDADVDATRDILQQLLLICIKAQRHLNVFDVDKRRDQNPHSALSRRLPGVLAYDKAPSADDMRDNPYAMDSHFDGLLKDMCRSNVFIDFGADTVSHWLAWAKETRAAKDLIAAGVRLDFAVVTTCDISAVSTACDVLEQAKEIFGGYSALTYRPYAILNEKDGTFNSLIGTIEHSRLSSMVEIVAPTIPNGAGPRRVDIGKGGSEMFLQFEASDLAPTELITLTEQEIVEKWGVAPTVARRGRGRYLQWLLQTADRLLASGLVGEESPQDTALSSVVSTETAVAAQMGPVTKGKGREKAAQ